MALQEWQQITIMLSIIGFLGAAGIYMVSVILKSDRLKKIYKREILEGVVNIFAALLLMVLLYHFDIHVFRPFSMEILHSVSPHVYSQVVAKYSRIYPPTNPPIGVIATYLVDATASCPTGVLSTLVISNTIVSFSAGFSTRAKGVYVPISYKPGFLLAVLNNALSLTMFMIMVILLYIKILAFSTFIAPTFIYLGFMLRAFTPTRGAGGYMVAVGLAFYYVLPLSYIYVLGTLWSNETCTLSSLSGITGFVNATSNVSALANLFEVYFSHRLFNIFTELSTYTANLITDQCLIPLIALAITFTFTNVTSTIFGDRLSEIGRGLIKFI